MRVYGRNALALLGLGVALSAAPASAATICVAQSGSCPNNTITAGITAAAATGDTISIASGTYTGEGTIVVNKSVKIIGAGVVIVDNEIQTGYTGFVFDIQANNVSMTNMTIRNGRSDGIRVGNGFTGFVATSLKINGAQGDCIELNGGNDLSKVTTSSIKGCGDYGVRWGSSVDDLSITNNTFQFANYAVGGSSGNRLIVTGNKFHQTWNGAVYVTGIADQSKIGPNTIYQTYSDGIYMGDSWFTTIASNIIGPTDGDAIYINGNDPVVMGNNITGPYGYGIEARGPNAQVKSNIIKSAYSEGIYAHPGGGPNTADDLVITGNKITLNNPGEEGIYVADANDATISSNVITNAYTGIYFTNGDNPTITLNSASVIQDIPYYISCYNGNAATECSGGLVKGNKSTDNADDDYGFEILVGATTGVFKVELNTATRTGYDCFYLSGTGSGIAATGNKGYDCGMADYSNGIYTLGSGHVLTGNQMFRASSDGYYIGSTNTTLTGNLSDHASEDGFDIHANNVTLSGNKANFSNGVGFETATVTGVLFTGGNTATGNALGACFTPGSSTLSGANSFGTSDNTQACTEANGFIGD